jgi:hypothetical protein
VPACSVAKHWAACASRRQAMGRLQKNGGWAGGHIWIPQVSLLCYYGNEKVTAVARAS